MYINKMKEISLQNSCEIDVDKIPILMDEKLQVNKEILNKKLIINDDKNNNIIMDINKMNILNMSKSELQAECVKLDINGYKSKNKKELIEIITKKTSSSHLETKEKNLYKLIIEEDEELENTICQQNEILDSVKPICESFTKLINGDCLIEMKNIETKSVNLILCDLPYGMTKNSWDAVIPFDKLWIEYNRIIKDNGAIILFCSQPFTSIMITSNLSMFRYSLVWEKNKFSDFLNAKRKPMKTNEDIAIFYKKQPVYNPQYWYSTPYTRWNTQTAVDKQTNYGSHKENFVESVDGKRLPTTVLKFNRVERPKHPTQKPVDLLEWLIKTYTNEGDVVLDNCMGVGSTGVACKNLKRSFIGIELEKKYFDMAVELINN
jgi:site-specific DNA-methyltransferase (adenine-specific)